jgi:hypothetical protein
MDYLYENLGPERFQEFCSCLIAKEFPEFQAFPIGQRDGGRDSLAYIMGSPKKEFIIFQVKYVRNPQKELDVHKWMTEIIKKEAPKIEKLIPRGAKKFYFLTNVRGTAYLDAGSIDKVNKILEEEITVPSVCWWRADLSRRFEKDPMFKWSFPEVLNGQDILNSILFQNINENKERRENTIKAYLVDQYDLDNEVKFKQIELQNKLFDLFTDVPIRIKKFNKKKKNIKQIFDFVKIDQEKTDSHPENNIFEENNSMGAAAFLLHPITQNEIERILLEGAPGQGKSTISQYICQIHRAKLLNKTVDLELLPDKLKNTSVRLPFKIDLRDIATWVKKNNPYQGAFNEEYFIEIWKNSLESFLIGHIVYHSKIDDFSTSDLIAITKYSSILFVFDGFDEIASLEARKEVVDFINKGLNRISENAISIQVLITSRPAAFLETVGFSIDLYPHFELTDITLILINQYVDKWIKASRLDSREAAKIRNLVKDKLEMPHLRDLAKNLMQLAIFISLLRTRGESLPNKRTALYDSYIELFFNRESEKSIIVRDHRDLIIDIHQYLAWILHSEAELLKNNGRIQIEDLKLRLKMYLDNEGHNTDIADQLFDVLSERVCALVSRVQGTFEFEVQPLREYFCAKYLYNTSPYSPTGKEKKGTKPDRFDAISKNTYWNNVVRFFAGCFDKGELPMLIDKLYELQNDVLWKYTNYPRLITSQILSDWVFTQYPKLLKDVVKILVDGIHIGNIINQDSDFPFNNEPILLPDQCGRTEIVTECFLQLKSFPSNGYASELISIIKNNPYKKLEYWIEYAKGLSGDKLVKWLAYAYQLQIIHIIEEPLLIDLVKEGTTVQILNKIQTVINGNRLDIIDKDKDLKQKTFSGLLNGSIFIIPRRSNKHSLYNLSKILHPFLLKNIFEDSNSHITFANFVSYSYRYYKFDRTELESLTDFKINDSIDNTIKDFFNSTETIFNKEIYEWRNSLIHWDILVENSRKYFNDEWMIQLMSVIAAGIKSKDEIYEDFNNLNDDTISLCKRVRHARLKSGNIKYWKKQLDDMYDLKFTLLVFFTWATSRTIIQLLDIADLLVITLSEEEYLLLIDSLDKVARLSKFSSSQQKIIKKSVSSKNFSEELLYLISLRFTKKDQGEFIYNNINKVNQKITSIADTRLQYLINKYYKDNTNLSILKEINNLHSNGHYINKNYYRNQYFFDTKVIPIDVARMIMEDSKNYPLSIVFLAEKSCMVYANKKSKVVGQIANEESWFEY